MIFSYIQGNLVSVLSSLTAMNSDIEEKDQLHLFFNILKGFNHEKPMKKNMQSDIEAFFDFKWCHDEN